MKKYIFIALLSALFLAFATDSISIKYTQQQAQTELARYRFMDSVMARVQSLAGVELNEKETAKLKEGLAYSRQFVFDSYQRIDTTLNKKP